MSAVNFRNQGWSTQVTRAISFCAHVLALVSFLVVFMSCRYYPKEVEVWKDIPGLEGYYQASTHGNIRSLDRYVLHSSGGLAKLRGKILKSTNAGGYGYRVVALSVDGVQKRHFVHRLILLTFIGACPNKMEACHNDGVHWKNNINNLRWDTPKNNQGDRVKHGTSNRGEACGNNKLTEEKVIEIKLLLHKKKLKQTEIAKLFNVNQSAVSKINCGEMWGWLNLKKEEA